MPDMPVIDVRPDLWEIVRNILQKHVPQCEVWAFGSRAKWTAKEYSDLDLAIITDKPLSFSTSAALREDFSESDLPWRVDFLDWATTSESFREVVVRDKVVVQTVEQWPMVTIGDVAKIKHGFAFKGEFFTGEATPHILVAPGNFAIGGGFQMGKPKYYSGPLPDGYALAEGDIVVTMTDLSKASDTLGYAAKIPATSGVTYWHNQRIGLLQIRDEQRVCKEWLHYLMRTREYRAWVVGSASGTTVKHTSPSRIESFSFKLPPLEEQHTTAEILGALDDRIDNLRQTSSILETMAQALFKSWFVDFDGVQPEDMHESELGLIPKGWQIVPVSEIITFNPKESLRKNTIAPYLDMASLSTRNSWTEPPILKAFGSGMRFRNGDALLARITPCLENGKSAFVQNLPDETIGWGSTEFIVMRSKKPVPQEYAYLLARHDSFREYAIRSMTGTSGRQRVQADVVAQYKVVIPSDNEIWRAFSGQVNVLFKSIKSMSETIKTLVAIRDTLLPKLISGALRIPQST